MTYNNVKIDTSKVINNEYTISITENSNSVVNIVINNLTGKVEGIKVGVGYNAE